MCVYLLCILDRSIFAERKRERAIFYGQPTVLGTIWRDISKNEKQENIFRHRLVRHFPTKWLVLRMFSVKFLKMYTKWSKIHPITFLRCDKLFEDFGKSRGQSYFLRIPFLGSTKNWGSKNWQNSAMSNSPSFTEKFNKTPKNPKEDDLCRRTSQCPTFFFFIFRTVCSYRTKKSRLPIKI